MIDPDEHEPYRVQPDGSQFKVLDWENSTLLTCGDEASARQHVVMLSQAYRRGFKAGFRKARQKS